MNNHQQINEILSEETKRRRESTRAKRLAESLAVIGRLQEGSQLVMLLGDGHERSNLEALTSWVKRELKNLPEGYADPLDYLYAALLAKLP